MYWDSGILSKSAVNQVPCRSRSSSTGAAWHSSRGQMMDDNDDEVWAQNDWQPVNTLRRTAGFGGRS